MHVQCQLKNFGARASGVVSVHECIDAGADVNTGMYYAYMRRSDECVDKAGACLLAPVSISPRQTGNTAMHIACQNNMR